MAQNLRISVLSKEYVKAEVTCDFDPTSDVVAFAFKTSGDPVTTPVTDWVAGSWDTSVTTSPYIARVLVGPSGDKTLATGKYNVWIKITDSPEVPVRKFGTLEVY